MNCGKMLTLLQQENCQRINVILIYGKKYGMKYVEGKPLVRWGAHSMKPNYNLLTICRNVGRRVRSDPTGLEKYNMEVDPFCQAY